MPTSLKLRVRRVTCQHSAYKKDNLTQVTVYFPPLGIVTEEEIKDVKEKYERIMEESYQAAQSISNIKYKDWLDSPWSGFFEGKDPMKASPTGVHEETLTHIGKR